MSEREKVESWSLAVCSGCAMPFGKEYHYMDLCPYCYKEQNGYKILKGDLAFVYLQQELQRLLEKQNDASPGPIDPMDEADWEAFAALQAEREELLRKVSELQREVGRLRKGKDAPGKSRENTAAPDLALLRKMIKLCHPDKHKDSPEATEVTQWITAQMDKSKR